MKGTAKQVNRTNLFSIIIKTQEASDAHLYPRRASLLTITVLDGDEINWTKI